VRLRRWVDVVLSGKAPELLVLGRMPSPATGRWWWTHSAEVEAWEHV